MKSAPGVGRDHPGVAVSRVAKNTAYLALADVANKVMVFFFFTMAARHLGADRFGLFSLALAFSTMLAVFADIGLGFHTTREVARDSAAAAGLVGNALAIKALVSLGLVGIAFLLARLVGYSEEQVRLVTIASLFILPSSAALYYASVFQGFERMELIAFSRMLQTGVLLAGGFALGRSGAGPMHYAWLYVGASLACACMSAALSRALSPRLQVRIRPAEWPPILKSSFPFGLSSIFVVLYYWIGTALLSRLGDSTEVGLFSAAFRLVLGVGFLSYAFSGAMYPVMSRLHIDDADRLRSGVSASLRYVLILAVPMGVLGTILAEPVIRLVYGSNYDGASAVLRVLVWWGGLASLNSMLSNYLYAVDRPRAVVLQSAVALAANLVLNLLLIPVLGGIGVAVSITVAESVSLAMLVNAQRRTAARVNARQLAVVTTKCFLACAGAGPIAWFLALRGHALVAAALAFALYLILLVLLRGFDRSDSMILRRVIGA